MKATATPLDRTVMGGLSEMLTCSSNSKGKESEPDKNREGKERGGEGRRRETRQAVTIIMARLVGRRWWRWGEGEGN